MGQWAVWQWRCDSEGSVETCGVMVIRVQLKKHWYTARAQLQGAQLHKRDHVWSDNTVALSQTHMADSEMFEPLLSVAVFKWNRLPGIFSAAQDFILPGFNDLTPQTDLLRIFKQLQTQMDLSLNFFIRVNLCEI